MEVKRWTKEISNKEFTDISTIARPRVSRISEEVTSIEKNSIRDKKL